MMLYWTTTLTFGLLLVSFGFYIHKRARARRMLAVFRAYNAAGADPAVLTAWIEEKDSALRLLEVLEFFEKIEEPAPALAVLDALPADPYPVRAVRLAALKLMRGAAHPRSGPLADALLAAHPDDDVVREAYIATQLDLGRPDAAEKVLMPRLAQGETGTAFAFLHARLLAAKGRESEAMELLDTVVSRDYMRYKNTVAPMQKALLYEQYLRSQTFFDDLRRAAGLLPEAPTADASGEAADQAG